MNDDQIAKVYKAYGLDCLSFYPVEKGYRNESHSALLKDGRKVNLILYKYEHDIIRTIRNANIASNFLAKKHIPVRSTIDSRIIHIKSGQWQKYASVYNYLPGETIPWEAYTRNHIKILGKAMSDMHYSLKELTPQRFPNVSDLYLLIIDRMQDYFSNKGVVSSLSSKLNLSLSAQLLDKFRSTVVLTKSMPSQQVLHMDFVRSNILFTFSGALGELGKYEISGIIDFEKVAFGHPFYDIARTYAFLLVDCKFKTPDQIKKYFLHSGYEKRGKNVLDLPLLDKDGDENTILYCLVDLFLAYDFYKFLRHNPYESLKNNEHFIRTRELLVARRLIP